MAKPDLVYTTYIRTTSEKLWQALTHPEFTRQYWGDSANVSDWKKGSKWDHTSPEGVVHHTGIIEEIVPFQRLVLTWHNPGETEDVSRVTFELIPLNDTVQLNIIHGDFTDSSVMADRVCKGWPIVIASLKSYLETGAPLDIWSKGCGSEAA
ncbi:MAG: SRPBCC family protein [Alphaproteobacteria bacterium]|nr:SRPBCC family protein [Alphaproteobacteria bacterium]MBU0858575.1 SRPBCC family protein [Alphaproteobacteria bacterium]